jgi:hypothetical protein
VLLEVCHRLLDRTGPREAEVTVPRPDALLRDGKGLATWTVDVELLVAEPVRHLPWSDFDQFCAQNVSVERIRSRPVRD